MDKNPQDRISIHLQRRIIQGFPNIIRLVVFLKRDTHSLKMIYITFFTLHAFIIMRKTHMYGNNFWNRRQINSKLLKTHFGRLSSTGGKPGQYSVKPLQPGR